MEVFEECGKPEYPGENQQSTEPTNSAQVTLSLEIKPVHMGGKHVRNDDYYYNYTSIIAWFSVSLTHYSPRRLQLNNVQLDVWIFCPAYNTVK